MRELRFTWDPTKAKRNALKHGVTFEEAETIFEDEFALLSDDPEHSESEERLALLGLSERFRLLTVSHCYRQTDRFDEIRIISARRATAGEKRDYSKRWRS